MNFIGADPAEYVTSLVFIVCFVSNFVISDYYNFFFKFYPFIMLEFRKNSCDVM